MKICAVGSELFHADTQNKGNSRFSKFCECAYRTVVVVVVVIIIIIIIIINDYPDTGKNKASTIKISCLEQTVRNFITVFGSQNPM
jgi:hypothetical protein